MAIHDVDKTSSDRGSPQPNSHDLQGVARMAHNTTSVVPTTGTQTSRIAFKNNVLLYYDDQNRVIRVDGFIPGLANYPVTIIAKYGNDVYTDILGLIAPSV